MRLLRSFPVMTFVLVLLSIVGFCAAQKSVELLLIASTLAALSWYVTEGPRGRTLPRWVSSVLVIAVSLSAILDLLQQHGDWFGALGRFSVWLTLIKLYERRTARDHAHLLGLSLLLMLIGCLKTAELLFGIVLLLYAALGVYVLLLYQLYATYEHVEAARQASFPGGHAAPPLRPTIGRRVGLHFRALAAGVGLSGVVLSALLFVIFPRSIGRGLLERPFSAPAAGRTTGYADEIDLVGGTRITPSRRVVFDLTVRDESGGPVRLPGPLRLRGAVLDRYEDGHWSASGARRKPIETTAGVLTSLGDPVGGPGSILTQEFRFHAATPTVFSLYVPRAIRTGRSRHLAYEPTTQTVTALPDGGPVRSYAVLASPDPSDEAVAAAALGLVPDRAGRGRFRDAPGDPSVAALARRVLEEAGLPAAPRRGEDRWPWNVDAARALAGHLRAGAYVYTLDLSDVVTGSRDPIVAFLFESRRGHCEFFASALAAMCHTVGIDARIVTGYVASEYDEAAERYVVLAANAHAWVEVPSGAYRYATVDPTPPAVLQPRVLARRTFTDRVGWLYQRLEGTWTSGVVDFDERSQTQLLGLLEEGWPRRLGGLLASVREWTRQVNRAFYFGWAGYVWMGIVALAVVIAVIAVIKVGRRVRMVRRALRLRHLRDAESRRQLRQLGFYVDMLIVLRRAGCAKPSWQPPLAFARTLGPARPEAAAIVEQITGVFYDARYGRRPLTRAELGRAHTLVERLARTLRVRR